MKAIHTHSNLYTHIIRYIDINFLYSDPLPLSMARKIRIDTTLSPEVINILKEAAPPKQKGGIGSYIESAIIDKALSEGDLRALELKEQYLSAKKAALASEIEALNSLLSGVEAELSEIRARKVAALRRKESRQDLINEVMAWIEDYNPSGAHIRGVIKSIEPPGGVVGGAPIWVFKYKEYSEAALMEASMADFMRTHRGRIAAIIAKAKRALVQISEEDIKALYADLKRSEVAIIVNDMNKRQLELMQDRIKRHVKEGAK